ncbi:unnamed protein product, partial [Cylicostephanus goldi]
MNILRDHVGHSTFPQGLADGLKRFVADVHRFVMVMLPAVAFELSFKLTEFAADRAPQAVAFLAFFSDILLSHVSSCSLAIAEHGQ